ncbi:unnamed protein product [Orchesella dallaii]|uniref:Gustatory receptor n=1 Tax=Orchesella dallaii TaxID=48710 RepID=A0ABP1RRC1_9HEXA
MAIKEGENDIFLVHMVKKQSAGLKLKKYPILATVLVLSSFMSFISFFSATIFVNIYAEPNKVFDVAIYGAVLFYCLVFFCIFWRKRNEILHFANLSTSNFLCGNKLVYAVLSIYPLILDVLIMDQLWVYAPFTTQESWSMRIYKAASLVSLVTYTLLTTFVDSYVAILAISGYNQVTRSFASLHNLIQWKMAENQWKLGDFSCLIEIAEKLERFFKSLNLIGCHIILTWFCMLVPWVSCYMVEKLPGTGIDRGGESILTKLTMLNKRVIGQIFYWSYIALYIGILGLCAEIKKECDHMKRKMKKIILQYDPKIRNGKAAFVQIEHLLKNVGIHGGFFFTFSYSFLGSTAGLVMAYSFLSLQLRLNCCSAVH